MRTNRRCKRLLFATRVSHPCACPPGSHPIGRKAVQWNQGLSTGGVAMSHPSRAHLSACLGLIAALAASSNTQADALLAVQVLREGGCGGRMPAAAPLHHNPLLDRAAERWASGAPLSSAAD